MLYVVQIQAEAELAPRIEADFELAGDEGLVCWQDADTGAARFECYHAARAEAEQRAAELRARLQGFADSGAWSLAVVELPDAEWQEAWKLFFPAERVSPNVMVRPPWEPGDSRVRCVVEINPGLSFGTGRHFTTRTCLQALDRVSSERPGASLVDVGCGSGILAIAAAKLGFTRVTAIDDDPQAIQSARENCMRNGVADRVTLVEAGLGAFRADAPFDVVVANLYDELLRRFAPLLAGLADPGRDARLVLSGMLGAQAPAVRAAYATQGFTAVQTWEDHEWTTLLVERRG